GGHEHGQDAAAEDHPARPELSGNPETRTMAVGATSSTSDVNVASSPASSAAADATMTSDRFLKLLVAQMKNQDPLNPMDNAQVTSQMAQINTVTGIDKLNSTVAGLSAQFMQMQA